MIQTRLKAQIIKELLSLLRDPKSRIVLIMPPLMQLLIFSFAATLEIKNVTLAVLDEDRGRWAFEVTQRLVSAGFISEIVQVDTVMEMQESIDKRRALAALRFQPDFSRSIDSERPAAIQVILDGRRANGAQILLGYLNSIVATLNEERAGAAFAAAPQVIVRNWFNPNLIYQWFIVPALVGTLAMASSLIVCALSIARERELGTFDQLLVSPARPLEIIVGKMIPALIVGSSLGCLMILAGVFAFDIPFTGSLLLVLASLVMFILSVVGIGLMVSSICMTQQQAILGAFSLIVPLILLSGFATPVENMAYWLQLIAQANPLKHFLVIVQGSFLKALPFDVVLRNVWPMFVIFLFTFTMAVFFIKKRLQ